MRSSYSLQYLKYLLWIPQALMKRSDFHRCLKDLRKYSSQISQISLFIRLVWKLILSRVYKLEIKIAFFNFFFLCFSSLFLRGKAQGPAQGQNITKPGCSWKVKTMNRHSLFTFFVPFMNSQIPSSLSSSSFFLCLCFFFPVERLLVRSSSKFFDDSFASLWRFPCFVACFLK